ncbi:XdhC family protein [Paenibacillus sp. H1-7]|uniref:XdhC family protein n=1 Tax=Paenibacillus sp. H1-7 TaxID=2282849 RepID=UPI001EF847A6|nr:XdhC family protein [Paenibacillus sp. H1-7]ULL14588.1 XdhC family protein [Paenibacillus sp. H1-7]
MNMHRLLQAVFSFERVMVLATVVEVDGHAYRKAGAAMLLMGEAGTLGEISPGCLEADLNARVDEVWSGRVPVLVEYDMRPTDDLSWGEAVGCGGFIRVLLEPIDDRLREWLSRVKRLLDEGMAVRFARIMNSDFSEVLEYRLEAAGREAEEGLLLHVGPGGGQVMECVHASSPRLLLFGATDDAIPVAELAAKGGFRVLVADWRQALCTKERFAAASLFVGSPKEILLHTGIKDGDYVVLMSHYFPKDQELLRLLMPIKLKYLGIMGSRTRTERMLEKREVPEWLEYPVGMAIGADGAEEIAVSIVAQLIQVRRLGMLNKNVEKAGEDHGYSRDLLGSRRQPPDGAIQAVD